MWVLWVAGGLWFGWRAAVIARAVRTSRARRTGWAQAQARQAAGWTPHGGGWWSHKGGRGA